MADSKYRAAGVDIDAAADALEQVKPAIRATHTSSVLADVGSFGGLFALDGLDKDSVLVASMDGVGTKVKLAADMGRWRGIGFDIVNHCVNDILVQNARPLFFMDYVASSALDPQQVAEVILGVAEACRSCGCALLGGETAEMPGVYVEGAFDVVGAIVGSVERGAMLPKKDAMQSGDVLFGLPSSGPHTNGYSLIRRVISGKDLRQTIEGGVTLGDALLAPHRSYTQQIDALQRAGVSLLGLSHITGGGLVDNIPRVLPDGLRAVVTPGSWRRPEVFRLLVEWASMTDAEAYRVFNMGIGMVLIVPAGVEAQVAAVLPDAVRIGVLAPRTVNGASVTFE
jgi:phosphoribosylformylglycinamidine cyclo-ligase